MATASDRGILISIRASRVYVSLERENKLDLFTLDGDTVSPVPRFRKETLAQPHTILSRQAAGTVHVHLNGRFGTVFNRADTTTEVVGQKVFVGGENTLATYHNPPGDWRADADRSRRDARHPLPHLPHRPQRAPAGGGAYQVGAGAGGTQVRNVPACLSVFRIGNDGKLAFVRKV